MIFKWLLDEEISSVDKLLLSLYDHGAFSPRQFCVLAKWELATLRVMIHRLRKKVANQQWIQTDPTSYHLDRTYYALGKGGLAYCGRKLNKRVSTRLLDEVRAQHTHILGLNEILVRLIESEADRKQLIWLSTKEATDYLYRLCRMQNHDIRKQELIRPDAYFSLTGQSYWIEYDNSYEGPFELERKMISYVEVLESLQKWQNQSKVIWVVRDKSRKQYLEKIWHSLQKLNLVQPKSLRMYFFVAGAETFFLLNRRG